MTAAVFVGLAVGTAVGVDESTAQAARTPPTLREGLFRGGLVLASQLTSEAQPRATERWKRLTPMEAVDARRHLERAWEQVLRQPAPVHAIALLLAHWALETGHGFAMSDHNFAGLKGRAPGGGSALWWTWERDSDGRLQRVRARFRAYATPEAGARDYLSVLQDRYADALSAAERGDADSFVSALERRGYFSESTDDYRRAIRSLMRSFVEQQQM